MVSTLWQGLFRTGLTSLAALVFRAVVFLADGGVGIVY